MRKERKHFTPEEKVAILGRHLLDKAPVSELCEELGLRPTVFYRWQKELFENRAAHVRTSLSYPQSNGKPERWHKSLKNECIRPGTPLSLADAKRLIQQYVNRYNNVRLHSAIRLRNPEGHACKATGRDSHERDRKPEAARQQRQSRRKQAV